MRASEPLKSKRLAISLFAWSTAFLTSGWFTCETMSKEGMAGLPVVQPLHVLDPAQRGGADPVEVGRRVVGRIERQVEHAAAHQQQRGAGQQVLRARLAARRVGQPRALEDRLDLLVAAQLGDQRWTSF